MFFKITTIFILISSSLCLQEKTTFEGYQLIRIRPSSFNHIQLLNSWENNPDVNNFIAYFYLK